MSNPALRNHEISREVYKNYIPLISRLLERPVFHFVSYEMLFAVNSFLIQPKDLDDLDFSFSQLDRFYYHPLPVSIVLRFNSVATNLHNRLGGVTYFTKVANQLHYDWIFHQADLTKVLIFLYYEEYGKIVNNADSYNKRLMQVMREVLENVGRFIAT